MDTKIENRWRSHGCSAPASSAPSHAEAGSRRVYYSREQADGTDRHCYRAASWRRECGVHGFYLGGEGNPCDEWGRDVEGPLIPASEFD